MLEGDSNDEDVAGGVCDCPMVDACVRPCVYDPVELLGVALTFSVRSLISGIEGGLAGRWLLVSTTP